MTAIERAVAAAIANLHEQAQTTGCTTEDNGTWAQVDGSFKVEPVVRAVIAAIREPSVDMRIAGGNMHNDGQGTMWRVMIDRLLEE